MAKKRTAHEKKFGRRQINMQLRFAKPEEAAAMDAIAKAAKIHHKSESQIARDLLLLGIELGQRTRPKRTTK